LSLRHPQTLLESCSMAWMLARFIGQRMTRIAWSCGRILRVKLALH
jgi:hypothetical protein